MGGHGLRLESAPDDRSLIENYCIKEAKQPWDLRHPPQKTAWAVRVHVLLTLSTAYRLPYEREATGAESMGWQRRAHQLLERNRDKGSIFSQGSDDIYHVPQYSLF